MEYELKEPLNAHCNRRPEECFNSTPAYTLLEEEYTEYVSCAVPLEVEMELFVE